MKFEELIQKSYSVYGNNKVGFFASIGLELLNYSHSFDLLDISQDLKKQFLELSKEKSSAPGIVTPARNHLGSYIELLEKYAQVQRMILSSPENDEYVLLLASVKALDELKATDSYQKILKEILRKNLHKIESLELDSPFIGREKEVEEVARIVNRSFRNNILLIGPIGVGKTTLAKAMKIHLPSKRLFQLFPGNESFFDQIISILSATEDKKSLFFLDELLTFEPAQIKYLIDNAQIIGTANDTSFRKFSSDHPYIISRFEVINLEEPDLEEVKTILYTHQKRLSQLHHIDWEKNFLDELVQLSKQYIPDHFFPSKGISLLEESALLARNQRAPMATVEMLKAIISQKSNIPIESLTELEKKDLSSLPDRLKFKVKGQDEAVNKVSVTIQRARLGLGKKNKPIGSFLFVGPSGVGKTELAKALAHEVFGDAESMVRLDMSEFAEAHMVQRLIGSPPGYVGYEEGGQLTNPVKSKPYTLVLLDEIEKAHPRVFDIFLQVLDDGRLTDGQGKKVDFTNTVIVATSNAGIEEILDLIEDGKTHKEIANEIKEILTDNFRVEFINRFDSIIIFEALKPQALSEIARLQVEKLKIELEKRQIGLSVSDETLQRLAEEAYDPRYGARGLLRLIQEKIENSIAEKILSNELEEGSRIEF